MAYFSKQPSDFDASDYRSRNYTGVWQKIFIDEYVDRVSMLGLESTIDEMSDYNREHFPTHLYKFFRPTSFSLMSLESDNLWLSHPKSFNDPFDSYVCIEKQTFEKKYVLNELTKGGLITKEGGRQSFSETEKWQVNGSYSKDDSLFSGYYHPEKKFDNVLGRILTTKSSELVNFVENERMQGRRDFRKIMDEIRNVDLRITCFANLRGDTELARLPTMWPHYADNHTGFCVKYSLKDVANFVKTGLLPVKYTSRVPTLSVPQLLKCLDSRQHMLSNPSVAKASRKALITKSAAWNYEKEWRLIVENERVDLLHNGCVAFPYPEAIYMGCRMEINMKLHLASLAKRKGLRVYDSRQNEEKFVLDIWETDLKSIKEDLNWNEIFETRAKLGYSTKWDLYWSRIHKKMDTLRDDSKM
jgi:hypothetical protein